MAQNFDVKENDFEKHMNDQEEMFDTHIPDSSSDEDESSGYRSKKHESTLSMNTNNNVVYGVPSTVNFYNWEKEKNPVKTLIIKNSGSICEEIILKGPLTNRFKVNPEFKIHPYTLQPTEQISFKIHFLDSKDPNSILYENFRDKIMGFTKYYTFTIPINAYKVGREGDDISFTPALNTLIIKPPDRSLFSSARPKTSMNNRPTTASVHNDMIYNPRSDPTTNESSNSAEAPEILTLDYLPEVNNTSNTSEFMFPDDNINPRDYISMLKDKHKKDNKDIYKVEEKVKKENK